MRFHEFDLSALDGSTNLLAKAEGKVVLAVNVASQCGFTSQYDGLQALFEELNDQEFLIIGFPCNQFGAQEPGSPEEIANFCQVNYNVTFPLSEKIEVNGDDRHPLYAWLTDQAQGQPGDIRWNFEKFLIGRDGQVIARYGSRVAPEDATLLQELADALE
ncbi:MAG: glutathione peroxidase [Pseudomonadota bacterium]